jgi:hypothetical protein
MTALFTVRTSDTNQLFDSTAELGHGVSAWKKLGD